MKLKILVLFLISFKVYANPIHAIPFELKHNKIYLEVDIDNVKCNLIYDTGATGLVLDSTFVYKEKLELRHGYLSTFTLKTTGFNKEVKYAIIRDWYKFSGDSFQGIIGGDFFKDFIIEIDYQNLMINLYDTASTINANYTKLPSSHFTKNLDLYNLFSVPLSLTLNNGVNISGDFVLDTGSSRNISLINQDLRLLDKEMKHINIRIKDASPHGFNNYQLFKCSETRFNNKIYEDLIIDSNSDINKGNPLTTFTGIIGGKFLQNFKLLINYKNSEIYIQENQTNRNFEIDYVTTGVGIRDYRKYDGKVIISSLAENIKSLQKLKIGDEVLKINDVEISDSLINYHQKLKTKAGEKIKYTVKRKKRIIETTIEVEKLL